MLRKCTLSENPGSQLNLSFTGRIEMEDLHGI